MTRPDRHLTATLLVLALGAGATSLRAAAPEPPPWPEAPEPPDPEEVVIDLEEMRAIGDRSFAKRDLDGDGMITEAEFSGGGDGTAFRLFDHGAGFTFAHGDAVEVETVTLSSTDEGPQAFAFEFGDLPDVEARFERLDADGDGSLSLDEFRASQATSVFEPQQLAAQSRIAVGGAFAGFDHNDDGVITRDEWPSPEREMAAMDQDGDGRVTLAEIAGDDIQIHRRAIIRTR